jgi:predicted XRE-type DNA-binding protein
LSDRLYKGSGNVFADLGLSDPEIRLAKAILSIHICDAIKAAGDDREEARRKLGITEARLTDVIRGRLSRFRIDDLFKFLNTLGVSVHVSIAPSASGEPGQLTVDHPMRTDSAE